MLWRPSTSSPAPRDAWRQRVPDRFERTHARAPQSGRTACGEVPPRLLRPPSMSSPFQTNSVRLKLYPRTMAFVSARREPLRTACLKCSLLELRASPLFFFGFPSHFPLPVHLHPCHGLPEAGSSAATPTTTRARTPILLLRRLTACI